MCLPFVFILATDPNIAPQSDEYPENGFKQHLHALQSHPDGAEKRLPDGSSLLK